MPLDRGIGRKVDPGFGAGAVADPDDRIEKADPLDKYQPLFIGLPVEERPSGHVVRRGLEDERSRQRVCPALPEAHRTRIARTGRHALAERRGEQQSVAIEPSCSALGFWQEKTAKNE